MLITTDALLYEEIDGTPVYYKGYHWVLAGQKSAEEIMGSSVSQAMIISIILDFLYHNLNRKAYRILTNEVGLHLSVGNNLSADIAICDKQTQALDRRSENYLPTPPKVVIEVDLKADVSDFASPVDYYLTRTRKLLQFGVEKVIWVNTQSETIMDGNELKPVSWDTPIELMPDVWLSVGKLVWTDSE